MGEFQTEYKSDDSESRDGAAKIVLATVNPMKFAITPTPITGKASPVKPHTKKAKTTSERHAAQIEKARRLLWNIAPETKLDGATRAAMSCDFARFY